MRNFKIEWKLYIHKMNETIDHVNNVDNVKKKHMS